MKHKYKVTSDLKSISSCAHSALFTTILFVSILLCSCNNVQDKKGKAIPLHYASYLRMQQFKGYVIAEIINPWDTTKTLHTYILIEKNKPLPSPMPEGTVVRTPLTHTIVYSSVHCSLLNEWHKLDCITGVCDLKYIMLTEMHKRFNDGKLVDIGNSMAPDAEKMIALNPDAILLSPYKDNGGYGKLDKTGIPLIECADYMETSPLGRAEWMKFYGLLYGCRDKADSLFAEEETNYKMLKKLASAANTHPTVFADMKEGATWMVPGGKSTVGIFLKDAGAIYMFSDRKESGSITISPAEWLNRCQKEEFWLIKYNNGSTLDYKELMGLDPIYKEFDAVRHHRVYSCNTGIVPFYEDVPFHPERLLKDLFGIFHPELLKNYNSKYYKSL